MRSRLANPQYRDGRFVNLEPEAPSTTSMADYTLRQFSGDEVREPPAPVPVRSVDKAALASWHPSTRPAGAGRPDPATRWLRLDVHEHRVLDGSHAVVEFVARYRIPGARRTPVRAQPLRARR